MGQKKSSYRYFSYLCSVKVAIGSKKAKFVAIDCTSPAVRNIDKIRSLINQQKTFLIMQSKAKKYGEYVEITAPVERTTSEEYPTLLGGEIWYN